MSHTRKHTNPVPLYLAIFALGFILFSLLSVLISLISEDSALVIDTAKQLGALSVALCPLWAMFRALWRS